VSPVATAILRRAGPDRAGAGAEGVDLMRQEE